MVQRDHGNRHSLYDFRGDTLESCLATLPIYHLLRAKRLSLQSGITDERGKIHYLARDLDRHG